MLTLIIGALIGIYLFIGVSIVFFASAWGKMTLGEKLFGIFLWPLELL